MRSCERWIVRISCEGLSSVVAVDSHFASFFSVLFVPADIGYGRDSFVDLPL